MSKLPRRPRLLAFILLGLTVCLVDACAARPFAQATSDLPVDPAAHYGVLPNGLRYVIRPNPTPKGRVSLRLLVEAGSLHENDDQRGLAHFLEHMAFNGSTHYAPGTLVERLQRLGMGFGADTNASTTYDRTVYQLELPDTKPATLEEGLQIFADYAGGLALLPAQIEKERGIILSEKRARDSVEARSADDNLAFTFAGTRFPERLVIGREEIIEHAQRAAFEEFYDTWYRPERMAVVVVGDIEVAPVERQITTALSGVKGRVPARPMPDLGKISDAPGLHVHFHAEPEAPATSVSISTLTHVGPEPDTVANRLKYLPRMVAIAMLDRRLAILAKKPDAPFNSGGNSVSDGSFDFYRQASIDLTCQPAQWAAALSTAEHELRRAMEHGFQAAELKEAVANFTNELEQTAKTANTRRSDWLAEHIVGCLFDDLVVITPAEQLALLRPALEKITVDECAAALRTAWAAPHRYVVVSGSPVITGDAVAAITAAYVAAHAEPVEPPAAKKASVWSYTDFGPAGRVESRREIDDLGVTLITFANGVRLNVKKTDFETNVIRVNARIGTGKLTLPSDRPGLALLGGGLLGGGLGRFTYDEVAECLAGKTVGLGFDMDDDALVFSATTNRDDFLLQLQLIAAVVTDAGYRPELSELARKQFDEIYTSLAHTTEGPIQTEVLRLLANGDPRFGLPSREIALTRTLDELKAWLAPQFATGPIEIALVGDLDVEAAITAVAKIFGALPTRRPKPPLTAERVVTFPAVPFVKTYAVPTEIPKSEITIYWPTAGDDDILLVRRLGLLADVFGDRLRVKIREELGDTYSPSVGHVTRRTFTNYGMMVASVTVEPAKAGAIGDTVLAIAADLAAHGVTEDELIRAKQPVLTGIRDLVRDNGYWIAVLSGAQEWPVQFAAARAYEADFYGITTADLDALAKTYLTPGRAFRVTVLPEKK